MRLSSLDYLRGLSAIGIVIYHFNSWSFGDYDSSSILSRFGLYGVSIFYILSGLTLFHIYQDKLFKRETVSSFFLKRIFRIIPLLWLITTITIVGAKMHFNVGRILLNYSGLFSILSPNSYIAGGAWSIGNELSFYLIFPLAVLAYQKNKVVFNFLTVAFFCCHIYYAFFVLSNSVTVEKQWTIYISPLNQVFFFISGMLIYTLNKKIAINFKQGFVLFIVSVLLFIFLPTYGEKSNLIVGWYKLAFTLICILITWSAFNMGTIGILPLHTVLNWLGEISYSVYLIHPLTWKITDIITSHISKNMDFISKFTIAFILTLILSHIIYTYFERIISKTGRKLIENKATVKDIKISNNG